MYLKFNLPWGNSEEIKDRLDHLLRDIPDNYRYSLNESSIPSTLDSLKQYVIRRSTKSCLLDGDLIQKEWFPSYYPDIFLSHSGKDDKLARKIQSILKKAGLEVFVDSTVWGCISDLQKEFDEKYCLNPGGLTYSYDKRNNSTAAIHMMLSTALTQVMDHSEYVFFLNTSKSNLGDAYGKYEFTDSPWIYHELSTAKVLRQHHGNNVIQESRADDAEAKLIHGLDMHDFLTLTLDDFRYWVQKGTNESPESILYDLLNMKAEQKRLEKLYSKIDESIK